MKTAPLYPPKRHTKRPIGEFFELRKKTRKTLFKKNSFKKPKKTQTHKTLKSNTLHHTKQKVVGVVDVGNLTFTIYTRILYIVTLLYI